MSEKRRCEYCWSTENLESVEVHYVERYFCQDCLEEWKLDQNRKMLWGESMFSGPTLQVEDDENDTPQRDTCPTWQNYESSKSTELTGSLPPRKRTHPAKDAEALQVWELYWNKHKNFEKVARELGIKLSTVKMKYQRGFELVTGKPFSRLNHDRYKKLLEQKRQLKKNIPCFDCPKQASCNRPCEKLEEILPTLTADKAQPLNPSKLKEFTDKLQVEAAAEDFGLTLTHSAKKPPPQDEDE